MSKTLYWDGGRGVLKCPKPRAKPSESQSLPKNAGPASKPLPPHQVHTRVEPLTWPSREWMQERSRDHLPL